MVQLFWISLNGFTFFGIVSLLLEVDVVQAGVQADDYEFGWFTTKALVPGQLPICTYCINALGDGSASDAAHGPDWNRTVGLYRCDGAQSNEYWAYNNSTNTIMFSRLTEKLCLDAVFWESSLLKLRTCNSSVATQLWRYEDHTLKNGLVDSNGNNFSLLAAPPDLGINPLNQDNTYPLFIANSTPSDLLSYTSNFTFLPTTNFVRSTDLFTTEGLLQISNSSSGAGGQIISNGGFDNSTILAGADIGASAWNQSYPSYFALCGWVIDYGPIDYVNSALLQAQSGKYSIHLNTHTDVNHNGSISQTFRTEVGTEYVLSFFVTGFPPVLTIPSRKTWECNPSYAQDGARLHLRVTNATASTNSTPSRQLTRGGSGGDLTLNFTTNVTDLTADTIAASWTPQTVNFIALTNVTTISFRSLNLNDSCGPMIDTVKVSLPKRARGENEVVPAVVGSIGGLAALIAVLVVVIMIVNGVRNRRERDYYSGLYKTEHARLYSIQELRVATKRFSSVIGEGGFGTVYMAVFPDGTVGAVKVEKPPKGSNSSSAEFKIVIASDEIAVLLRVHHRNLVNLIGFCIHKGRHMLVFEYLPNGSLYNRLHLSILPSPRAKSMDSTELGQYSVIPWKQRVKIASDVACGLEYLHHEADPPIVHRDVKSHNILLTTMDSAKLADFGLSKAAPVDATSFQSFETVVKGSIGYLDPQYFSTGVFSLKSDVYSFGVVLLELISGHQAIYNAASLASWAAPYLESPSLYHELVDKRLNGDVNAHELETLVRLSKMCMQEDGKMRPNMRQVVSFLNSRQLPSIGEEKARYTEEIPSSENYQYIYEAMLSDFESNPRDSSTGDSFLDMK
ncbi:unnamed protein product [Calypogeia fissa]